MLHTVFFCLQVIGLVLLADFIGGLFHWAEDTFGTPETPLWGPIFVTPNLVHHEQPTRMIEIHWLVNNTANIAGALAVIAFGWLLGAMSWQLLLFAVLVGVNQQAHRFEHAPRQALPRLVRWLQRVRILQDAPHHWVHHKDPHTSHYCVLTPWMNRVLEPLRFWRGAERLLVPVLGAPRREDLRDRAWYRSEPIWA